MPFLRVARGSLRELQALLLIGRDLGYIAPEKLEPFWPKSAEVAKTINGLLTKLEGDR